MGNGAHGGQSKQSHIKKKYGIDPSRITEIEGDYFLNLEREDYKLNREVLMLFDKENDFSSDKEVDASPFKGFNYEE